MPADCTDTEDFVRVAGPAKGDPATPEAIRAMGSGLSKRTRWLWARMQDLIGTFAPTSGSFPLPVSVSASTDTFTLAGHGLTLNDKLVFVPTGGSVCPAPIVFGTIYYARDVATDTFKIASVSGGAAIDITSAGLGTVYVAKATTPLMSAYVKSVDLASQVGLASGARSIGLETLGPGFPATTLYAFAEWIADHIVTIESIGDTVSGGDAMVGVTGYAGQRFTIVAGQLQTYLRLLANKAANVDGANPFTGANSHSGTETFTNGAIVEAGGWEDHVPYTVQATQTTLTMSAATASYYRAEQWNGAGGVLSVTLAPWDETGNSHEPEMALEFHPATTGLRVNFRRQGAGADCVSVYKAAGGIGFLARWKYSRDTHEWRYCGPGPFTCDSTEITLSNP